MSYHSLCPVPTWQGWQHYQHPAAQLQSATFCREGHTCLSDLGFLPSSYRGAADRDNWIVTSHGGEMNIRQPGSSYYPGSSHSPGSLPGPRDMFSLTVSSLPVHILLSCAGFCHREKMSWARGSGDLPGRPGHDLQYSDARPSLAVALSVSRVYWPLSLVYLSVDVPSLARGNTSKPGLIRSNG